MNSWRPRPSKRWRGAAAGDDPPTRVLYRPVIAATPSVAQRLFRRFGKGRARGFQPLEELAAVTASWRGADSPSGASPGQQVAG